jgi:hypothetical protein
MDRFSSTTVHQLEFARVSCCVAASPIDSAPTCEGSANDQS